jgi:hypothetical protein
MLFIIVPTFYVVYKIADEQTGTLSKAEEFKTKGAAIKWIANEGEKDATYTVQVIYRKR